MVPAHLPVEWKFVTKDEDHADYNLHEVTTLRTSMVSHSKFISSVKIFLCDPANIQSWECTRCKILCMHILWTLVSVF